MNWNGSFNQDLHARTYEETFVHYDYNLNIKIEKKLPKIKSNVKKMFEQIAIDYCWWTIIKKNAAWWTIIKKNLRFLIIYDSSVDKTMADTIKN